MSDLPFRSRWRGKQRRRRSSLPNAAPRARRTRIEHLEVRLALATTLLDENFNDDAVNTLPNTADFSLNATGPEGFIKVGGPGGMYGTPIAPAGNKSLIFDNPGAAQPVIAWSTEFSDDPAAFQTGRISFDLFMPEPSVLVSWTYLDVRFGYGGAGRTSPTTVGDTTVWNSFRINSGSPDIVFDNGNGGGSSAIPSNRTFHVEYLIDGATRTYQLLVDNVPVSFGGSVSRPWMSAAPGVNMIAFVGAFPLSSAPVAIDNLKVISDKTVLPEPWTRPENEPTDRLEWHQHRGNKRLTGLAQIDDNIVAGANVLWSQSIAARESWVAVDPAQGGVSIALPSTNQSMSQADRIAFGVGGPYFDLNGTGTLTAESTHSIRIIGDFLPGNGTLERLEAEVFDTTFGQGVVRLYRRNGGAWQQVWQSATIPSMFATANLIAGDFDNDGNLEVALTPWTNMYILDMATGQIEDTAAFKPPANESGRPYGWFGAFDMNGDGREEFVQIGDFQDFIAVMGWSPSGDLIKLWEHVFEPRLASKRTTHRPMAFPVRDITGDAVPEISTSIYNETGDQRWHVRVFNGLTGAPVFDLPDHAIDGSRDVDGDGDYELFVRQTSGSLLPAVGTIKILDWNGNGFDTLWSQENSRFVTQNIGAFPVHINSVTSTGKLDLLTGRLEAGGNQTFFTRQTLDASAARDRVEVWQWDATGAISQIGSAVGPNLNALAVREAPPGTPSILLTAQAFGSSAAVEADFARDGVVNNADMAIWQTGFGATTGADLDDGDADRNGRVDGFDFLAVQRGFGETSAPHILANNLAGQRVHSTSSAPPRASAVVARLDGPQSPPTVVVQGASNNITAFQPNGVNSAATLWTLPGTGGSTGASQFTGQHEFSGVAVGDITGDGTLKTLFATVGEAGQARLVAVHSDGSELWRADFDVAGGPRIFNQAGLTLWRTGHFRTPDHEDVLVQTMRGIGGTGEFHLLNGRTGQLIWRRTYGNSPGSHSVLRAAGEAHMPVYDWDGDGLDEAVNFHPDMYYVVDGTGTNLVDAAVVSGGVFPGGSPLYGAPIVDDFLGNGVDSVLWAGSYSQLGLVTKNGTNLWHTPFVFDNTPGFIQGVGDVDGNGKLDLLSPGHPVSPGQDTQSFFHAINAATGATLWTVPLPGHAFAPVGGAYADTPTLSVSADVDQDGRDESIFAIGQTLYAVGANPDLADGSIEWTFTPDAGNLSSPIIADANGDGIAEIIVVSTSGMIYGIGVPPPPSGAPAIAAAVVEAETPPVDDVGSHPTTLFVVAEGRPGGDALLRPRTVEGTVADSGLRAVLRERPAARAQFNDDGGPASSVTPSSAQARRGRTSSSPATHDAALELWSDWLGR